MRSRKGETLTPGGRWEEGRPPGLGERPTSLGLLDARSFTASAVLLLYFTSPFIMVLQNHSCFFTPSHLRVSGAEKARTFPVDIRQHTNLSP